MLVRNLQKKGDYERALLLQEENLALAIANESNVATARKNVNYGIIPEPTQDQLRSREEVIMDGITEINKARNQLLTLFKPEQVASFMSGMSEDTATFINVYWSDLKTILETKKRLTKVYFDKIIQQQSRKLERQAGITTERVRLPTDATTINEVEEIRRLLGPITDPIIEIYRRLLAMRDPLAISYWDLRSALPDDRELAFVSRMSDSDRQDIFQELSRVTRPINPDPKFWTMIASINDNAEFVAAADNALPVLDMDAIKQVFSDMNPDFFPMYDKQREGIVREINEVQTSRQRAAAAQSKPVPKPRGRPRKQTSLDVLADEDPVTEAQEEAQLGYAGFGQPAAVVEDTMPRRGSAIRRVLQRKKSQQFPAEVPASALPPPGIGPLYQAFTGVPRTYEPPLSRQSSEVFDDESHGTFASPRPPPVRGSTGTMLRNRPSSEAGTPPPPRMTGRYENPATDLMAQLRERPTLKPATPRASQRPRPEPVKKGSLADTIQAAMKGRRKAIAPDKSGDGFKRKIKSGRGIAPKPIVFHDFGKFLINGNALDNQLLQVKYQAGGSIPGFSKKIAISDTFQDLMKNLIDTGKLNKSMYKELGDEEKRALETLMIKAGIGADFGIKAVTPTDDLKKKVERYEILIGNYNGGNNATEVIHEIRSLILYFMKIGHISKKEAMATLIDLQ